MEVLAIPTMLIAALGQSDVKRVIAYSTCSQLGYMAVCCGLGNLSLALSHLITHASFKAALFLRAGSMIHVISSRQDARRYGMPHGIANATGFVLASLIRCLCVICAVLVIDTVVSNEHRQ
jgi:NADH:ubiquinone oxidoreductase subunit 5 (subunit L)/multisubunit Na+/H+ antiporter MnhA subunit